jgi:hypothetical protein
LVAVSLLLAGCATAPTAVSDRLFFGRGIPGKVATVSDAQWDTFVAEVITPRFPEGFTVYRAAGQWRGDDGAAVSEPVCILEVVHPRDAAIERRIVEIAVEYRRRFNQDAVMQVESPVRQTFWRR